MNPVLDRKTGALMALRTTLHRPARVSVEPQANAKVGWGAAQSTMLDLIVVPRVSTIVWVVGNNGLSAASHFQGAFWMRGKREDRMRERRENRSRFAWYIDPTSPGFLTLEHIEWTERTLTLNRMPLSENAELAQAKRRPIGADPFSRIVPARVYARRGRSALSRLDAPSIL